MHSLAGVNYSPRKSAGRIVRFHREAGRLIRLVRRRELRLSQQALPCLVFNRFREAGKKFRFGENLYVGFCQLAANVSRRQTLNRIFFYLQRSVVLAAPIIAANLREILCVFLFCYQKTSSKSHICI